ncbi:uncharacterized protein LOC123892263 [Trifolium pratense]|uniref:uncharacterized protein LOC123892263 n=1 Tax=Trifolium pratense TaxID=57577 RepID=UPI001E69531C|nr:uncharacterized protein LOC123892263 [Trifolium pratense]
MIRHRSSNHGARDIVQVGRNKSCFNCESDSRHRRQGKGIYPRSSHCFHRSFSSFRHGNRSRSASVTERQHLKLREGRGRSVRRNQSQQGERRRTASLKNRRGRSNGRISVHSQDNQAVSDVGRNKVLSKPSDGGKLDSELKRYVSFYFTNFPPLLSNFFLRKGFEVCGMLEDVFVSKKTNRYGEPYGFVRFSNVKDISKMTKALNAVWFGHYRVRASVALFHRHNTGGDKKPAVETVSRQKEVDGTLEKVRPNGVTKHVPQAGGGASTSKPGLKKQSGEANGAVKEGSGPSDGVCVGDIVIKLGMGQQREVRKKAQKYGEDVKPKEAEMPNDAVQEKIRRTFIRNYRTEPEDAKWAQYGLVATVINGEVSTVVDNRISDAGFSNLVISPIGVDKVFVRSSEGVDVLPIVKGAKEIFSLIFSNWMRWGEDVLPYRRGAWVRLYGIPLNAWNVKFFKLCVLDCGSFLRADSFSVDRGRLDFARVLIATSDLDIIKIVETVMVDGLTVDINIVEEWGYAMGEDTCLFVDDSESEASHFDFEEGHIDLEERRNVDAVIESIAEGLERDVCEGFQGQNDAEMMAMPKYNLNGEGEVGRKSVQATETSSPASGCVESSFCSPKETTDFRRSGTPLLSDAQERLVNRNAKVESRGCDRTVLRGKRTNSCPPVYVGIW